MSGTGAINEAAINEAAPGGLSVAFEIERIAPDGEIIGTFAPPGTKNPFAACWLPEWM